MGIVEDAKGLPIPRVVVLPKRRCGDLHLGDNIHCGCMFGGCMSGERLDLIM